MPNKKIGLLGGSFNPAHDGHIYISTQAIKLLGLDEIWWLVSPQNPLKAKQDMVAFNERFAQAKIIASANHKIIVSNFEARIGTVYTYDTLVKIREEYPQHNFVWLMGADNLLQFPKWYKWREIMALLPIAVFNRDGLKEEALSCEAAIKFKASKIGAIAQLIGTKPPAWAFLDIKPHLASATKIRKGLK